MLNPTDETQFLKEVRFALDYDEDESELTPDEYARFIGAKDDAQRGSITPRLLTEAARYICDVRPDWFYERRSVSDRWCRVFAAHGALERVVPGTVHMGRAPPTITIAGVRYYRL